MTSQQTPSDIIQLSPEGEVNSGGCKSRRDIRGRGGGCISSTMNPPSRGQLFQYLPNQLDKIKKELFVDKKNVTLLQLEFVYVSIDSVSGIIIYDFVANSVRKFFSTEQYKHRQAKFCLFLGICWCMLAASYTAKISSFETVVKQEAMLNSVPKQ